MKWFISLFCSLVFFQAEASFITIYYYNRPENAEEVRKIFLSKYQIPSYWIKTQKLNQKKCELNNNSEIVDLCIDEKGELLELSRNQKQINALKILRKRGEK